MKKSGDINTLNKPLKVHVNYFLKLVLICSLSAVLSVGMSDIGINKENTLMIFLVGVLMVTSVTSGYVYGAIASVLSVMLFNYFFTDPVYTLLIKNAEDVMLLLFFLTASLITSSMTSKFQHQASIAKRNAETARLLYDITKGFLNVTGTDQIIRKAINYIHDNLGYECRVNLYASKNTFSTCDFPADEEFADQGCYVIPIKGVSDQIGSIEIRETRSNITDQNEMLIKTIIYQMAVVLDREFIYNEREKIQIAMESERLKSTLLRSISHDLRTPLTGIIGASELILESFETLDPPSVKKLVSDIHEESTLLFKSVQNILDMTRISEGRMMIDKNYEAVDDIINQALALVPQLTSSGRLEVSTPEEILLINVDGKLMVHVLINLLDNAYKHSGEHSRVYLKTYREDGNVVFEISDNGAGIDPAIYNTMFDGFVTKHRNIADGSRGVGLGLAICKAIIMAHNGTITAENPEAGGAIFRVMLPSEEA